MKVIPKSFIVPEMPNVGHLRLPAVLVQSYHDVMKTPSGRADLKRISVQCGICQLTRYYSLTRGITRINRVVACEACRHCYQAFKREPVPVHCTKGDGSCWKQMLFPKTKCRCCWVTQMLEETPIPLILYKQFTPLLPQYIKDMLRGAPVKASSLPSHKRGFLSLQVHTGTDWKDVTHERAVAVQKMVFIDQPDKEEPEDEDEEVAEEAPVDMWGSAAAGMISMQAATEKLITTTTGASGGGDADDDAADGGKMMPKSQLSGSLVSKVTKGKVKKFQQVGKPSMEDSVGTTYTARPPGALGGGGKAMKGTRGSGRRGRGKRGVGGSKIDKLMVGIKQGLYGINLGGATDADAGATNTATAASGSNNTSAGSSSSPSAAPSPTPLEDDVTVEEEFEETVDHTIVAPQKVLPKVPPPDLKSMYPDEQRKYHKENGLYPDEQKKFLKDFNPRNSNRVRRKKDRVEYFDTTKTQKLSDVMAHDHKGRFVAIDRSLHDNCDCLHHDCMGCHFPCPKCRSTKCGAECRINRKWFNVRMDVEGTDQFFVNKKIKS